MAESREHGENRYDYVQIRLLIDGNECATSVPSCDIPTLIDRWFEHVGPAADRIIIKLDSLSKLVKEKFMAVSAAIQAFSDQLNVATDQIAVRLQALLDKIAAGTPLTAEDQALLDADVARLQAMGKDPENPVPKA